MKTPPKHIVIPALLLIYLAVMVGIFGIRLFQAGEYYRLYKLYEDSKDCVGIVVIDNYEELFQGMSES